MEDSPVLFAASAMMSTWTQWRWSYLVAPLKPTPEI
jgi:hypothetical protein